MKKIKVGIIGTGNIGCDLLVKVQRSKLLECSLFMGRNIDSKGMRFATSLGVHVSDKSIEALVQQPDACDIVFDATSAEAHQIHAPILKKLKKKAIDLTPSLIGHMCVPAINESQCLKYDNINMITCGGQATVPVVHAISQIVKDIKYAEIVASMSSKSAGPGTRNNIDEFTQTTKNALLQFSTAKQAKAIIILNPAEPPVLMNNTIYILFDGKQPLIEPIQTAVKKMEITLQQYVPGYKIKLGPLYANGVLTTMVQVTGRGDYLPEYSGNLDIITCAAVHMAEQYAKRMLNHA